MGTTQIDRTGFDPIYISDKQDQFFFQKEGSQLFLLFVQNGSVHAKGIITSTSVADIPSDELENDFLIINLERSKLNQEQLEDALFFISELAEGDYIGITVVLAKSMEYPDLDGELGQTLLMKNITIVKE